MPPRVQIGLLIGAAILVTGMCLLRIPGRFASHEADQQQTVDEGSGRVGYAADGLNVVMEAAADAGARGDFETAVEKFLEIPAGGDPRAVAARYQAGEILLTRLHRPTKGIEVFNVLLAHFPGQTNTRVLLATYLEAVGRQFEADQQRREAIMQSHSEIEVLVRLALNHTGVGNPELLQTLHRASPDDPNVQLGMALLDISGGNFAAAEEPLRRVVKDHPLLWTAQAALATSLIKQGKFDEFEAWRLGLPEGSRAASEIWLVRGQAAELEERSEIAARCYAEAVRIDPDDLEANQGAARCLAEIGRQDDAQWFQSRAEKLTELSEMVRADPTLKNLEVFERASELTEELGRPWEARAWTYDLATRDVQNPAHQQRLKHFQQILVPATIEKMRFEANPAHHVDVSGLPDT